MTDREKTVHCPICKRLFRTPQGLGMHLKHGCDLSEKKTFTLGKIPDRTQLCKEFTELTGGHWHVITAVEVSALRYKAGISFGAALEALKDECKNPTYENPAEVLRVMTTFLPTSDYRRFQGTLCEYPDVIPVYAIIEPDALLKAAVEFLKAEAARRENNSAISGILRRIGNKNARLNFYRKM